MCSSDLMPHEWPHSYAGRTSRTPVGRLLLSAWRAHGASLGRFLASIGYGNVPKGCRAFDAWLQTGDGPTILLDRLLASPWAPATRDVEEALSATRLQRAEAAVRAFRPMVQVYTEHRRPTGITLHGLCGGTGRVTRWLDATITQASDEEQDAQVRAFAAAYTRCFGPRDPFLGRVQGFLLFLRLGQRPCLFTPDAQRLGPIDVLPLGASYVRVGSRRLPPGLLWEGVRE